MSPQEANQLIIQTLKTIKPLDGDALERAAKQMDGLLKPPGSLGRLEELGIKMAGIQGNNPPVCASKLSLVYAGDHGVVAEGISASPPQVTAIMTRSICAGRAGINALAQKAGAILKVIDVGVATPYEEPENLIVRRIRKGTGNIRIEPAMTRDEAILAIATGIETTQNAIGEIDAHLVGIGEVGIGNTTVASALSAVFTDQDPSTLTGRGTGIGKASLKRKLRVIRDAIKLHHPDASDPIAVMAAIGGLEIAAMCGAMLGGGAAGAMLLIDGFISGTAALTACAMAPLVRERMVLSHMSAEPGHRAVAAKLGLLPVLDLGLRLGEGSGAAAVMPLIEAATTLLSEMSTLDEELIELQDPS